MKKLTLFLITVLMVITLSLIGENTVYGAEAEITGTADFSEAKFKVTFTGTGAYLKITDIKETNDENEFSYYYKITDSTTVPKSEYNKTNEIYDDGWKILAISNGKADSNDKDITSEVELNQELHLWILVYENISIDGVNTKLLVKDVELTRPEFPKYQNIFDTTILSNKGTLIGFNIPWSYEDDPKFRIKSFNIKIGEITDYDILKSIKNNESDGFEKLLTYAKAENSPLYNKTLTTSGKRDGFSSDDGDELIALSNLEDEKYYYMYAVLDDEDGKFYPVEGVTLAMADTFYDTTGDWFMFFMGEKDFKWPYFETLDDGEGTEKEPTQTQISTPKKDETTANGVLPYTGKGLVIMLLIATLTVLAIVFYRKNQKYRGIK